MCWEFLLYRATRTNLNRDPLAFKRNTIPNGTDITTPESDPYRKPKSLSSFDLDRRIDENDILTVCEEVEKEEKTTPVETEMVFDLLWLGFASVFHSSTFLPYPSDIQHITAVDVIRVQPGGRDARVTNADNDIPKSLSLWESYGINRRAPLN
ncbi:hypothetical protein RB195_004727 [Necator americanus]|uniref:Uncharacterized protein n=1 Tax=Necator americanus TaxID=51031 RepID=A0ABR1BN89_NECAM